MWFDSPILWRRLIDIWFGLSQLLIDNFGNNTHNHPENILDFKQQIILIPHPRGSWSEELHYVPILLHVSATYRLLSKVYNMSKKMSFFTATPNSNH